jgi:hypothetical protein
VNVVPTGVRVPIVCDRALPPKNGGEGGHIARSVGKEQGVGKEEANHKEEREQHQAH